jgi:hypothetical protein
MNAFAAPENIPTPLTAAVMTVGKVRVRDIIPVLCDAALIRAKKCGGMMLFDT